VKDLTLSVAVVLALALGLALAFFAVYPRVEPSTELSGLFVFVAVVLRLLGTRAWALWRRPRPPGQAEEPK